MIGILVKGWPRLSETFIAQELLAIQQAGIPFVIISLRHPTDTATHPIHRQITAPVLYLPEYLHQEPWRVLRALPHGRCPLLKQFLKDLWHDRSANRFRRLGQALVLARELPENVRFLYSHFLHTPTTVAHYTSLLTGLPFAISAHAKDIYTSPDRDIRQKITACQWLTTCTQANVTHLKNTVDIALHPKIRLLYHGLDTGRFPLPSRPLSTQNGSNPEQPVRLLSVGRAVPKKGYDDVLQALALLPPSLYWTFTHIGGGELLTALKAQAASLGLENRIRWLGAQPQEKVLAALADADIFLLGSKIASDGDRDGLPNVLMEAMSQQVACLATSVSAIPELIEDGRNGVLVPAGNQQGIQAALAALIQNPDRRDALAQEGYRTVHEHFSLQQQIRPLLALLQQAS